MGVLLTTIISEMFGKLVCFKTVALKIRTKLK